MARKYWRRQTLLAKTESSYGTDSTPAANTDGVLAFDVSLTPLQGDEVVRDYLLPHFGMRPMTVEGRRASLTFDIELQGSGTAGTAPAWGPLLLACGTAETVTEDTDVVYAPSTDPDNHEAVTIKWNGDGNEHVLVGARGTGTLRFEPRRHPMLRFEFQGLWVAPGAVALPDPDLSSWIKPLAVGKGTTTFSFGGSSRVLERLEVAIASQVEPRLLCNASDILITDRQTAGTMVIEALPYGTLNPFTSPVDETTYALQLVHGTVAGRIVQLDAPAVQLGATTFANSQGVKTWSTPLRFLPDSGDDEWSITVK